MYKDHGSARPAFTQGHHRWPVYLQNRLWGEVRDQSLIWLCGTCHDNLHGWLYYIMGERKYTYEQAQIVPPRAKDGAYAVVDWYESQRAA